MSKVPAADATLRILSYLAAQPRPTAASHIGRALEIPRSSLYDILQALIARGYVIHHAEDRAYGLGPSAHELSSGYNRHAPMARLGRRVVEGLVDKVGESGHLSILRGHEIVYLVEARAQNRTSLITDVGVRLDALRTASGRAILAHLPSQQINALYRLGPERTRAAVAIRKTRELGYGWEDGQVTAEFCSVAVPVLDSSNWPIAAMALTWKRGKAPVDQLALNRRLELLRDAASTLQRRLGILAPSIAHQPNDVIENELVTPKVAPTAAKSADRSVSANVRAGV